MVCGDLVHVAGLTDVALGVVDGAERFFSLGVCAVPEFGAVERIGVDVVQGVSRPRTYSLAAGLPPPIPRCHSSSTRRAELPPRAIATVT